MTNNKPTESFTMAKQLWAYLDKEFSISDQVSRDMFLAHHLDMWLAVSETD